MFKKYGLAPVFFASWALLTPIAAFAAGLPTRIVPASCDGPGGCQSICDVAQLAQNVLNTGIYVAVFLSAVMFAWAGWKSLTSGGDSHAYGEAKSIFLNVLIGLVIILGAWLVVDTLMKTLTNGSFGPWNAVC